MGGSIGSSRIVEGYGPLYDCQRQSHDDARFEIYHWLLFPTMILLQQGVPGNGGLGRVVYFLSVCLVHVRSFDIFILYNEKLFQ